MSVTIHDLMAQARLQQSLLDDLRPAILELRASHDRLLHACEAALPELSDRLPWHGILIDAIAKATESGDDESGSDIDRHGIDRSADAEGKRIDDAMREAGR